MKLTASCAAVLAFLFFVPLVSCSSHQAARMFFQNTAAFQRQDFSSLALLDESTLRVADDDSNNSLYYGGLLLYFHGYPAWAEIALRRAARTGANPWALESARLVVYFMTRDSRYNQIQPFLESVPAYKNVTTDTELFYYYAFALFLTGKYDTLRGLLMPDKTDKMQRPVLKPTLRRRVSRQSAVFLYDLLRALILMRADGDLTNDEYLYDALVSHRAKDMVNSADVFIRRVYQDTAVPPDINALVSAKKALREHDSTARDLFLKLDARVFTRRASIADLLQVTARDASYTPAMRALNAAKKYARNNDSIDDFYIDIARADLFFTNGRYSNSLTLYSRVFNDALSNTNTTTPARDAILALHETSRNRRALWRMLYSVIQTRPRMFLDAFNRVVQLSGDVDYFSNTIEEYFSVLLRRGEYARVAEDVRALRKAYPNNKSVRAELRRWHYVITRSKRAAAIKSNTSAERGLSNVTAPPRLAAYSSDAPFEYLLYTDDVTKEKFLRAWTAFDDDDTNPKKIAADDTSIYNALIKGYSIFGLYEYAADVAEENISMIDADAARDILRRFSDKSDNVRVVTIARKYAFVSEMFPGTEEDFSFLYPHGFYDKEIASLTQDDKERAVMYAFMREESSFMPRVVSGAGAVGLMQLLQSTAEDIASRVSYGAFNLSAPVDNIALGYHYFKYLTRVVDKPVYVFAAYNGGLGNVWKWQEKYDTRDLVVFADSLPFRETRNYVRKIFSSAIIYAMLYYGIPPDEMIAYLTHER